MLTLIGQMLSPEQLNNGALMVSVSCLIGQRFWDDWAPLALFVSQKQVMGGDERGDVPALEQKLH